MRCEPKRIPFQTALFRHPRKLLAQAASGHHPGAALPFSGRAGPTTIEQRHREIAFSHQPLLGQNSAHEDACPLPQPPRLESTRSHSDHAPTCTGTRFRVPSTVSGSATPTGIDRRSHFTRKGGAVHRPHGLEAHPEWGVHGVHVVILFLCCGTFRLPWSFLIWRGKGQPSPAMLALKLLRGLPPEVRQGNRDIHVLADAAFSSNPCIQGVVELGFQGFIGIPGNNGPDSFKRL